MFKQNKKYSKFVHLMGGIEGGLESSNEQSGEKSKDIPADAPKNEAQKAKDKAAGLRKGAEGSLTALGDKPKVEFEAQPPTKEEIKKYTKGYPEVKAQKAIVNQMKGSINKEHLSSASIIYTDNHEYVLLYDGSRKGDACYRLFKSKEKFYDDPSSIVSEVIKRPQELNAKDELYKKYKSQLGKRVKKHGEVDAAELPEGGAIAVLRDERKGYNPNHIRIFKGSGLKE